MKIIILGAGGIGSLVGAFLSKENDVLLVGREKHVDKINKNGLKISGCINKNFKVKAATKIESIDDDTLIILSTKAVDNEKSINEIKGLIKEDTIILSLQNGLGTEDLIKELVDCEVIRGIITAGTTFLEEGRVECSNVGEVYLEDSDASEEIKNMLAGAGFKAEISDDIQERIWIKLMVNCVMNTLTAIFRVKNKELSKVPELVKSVIYETVEVAEKEGLNFDKEKMYEIVTGIIQKSGENKSSMFQDILKGRKTEIDFMNGKIVELGKKHNIKTPVNETLVSMIKFAEI